MLADFTIHIHEGRKPMAVQVKVHESTKALRSAVTQYDRRHRSPTQRGDNETAAQVGTLGVCHRFHWSNSPVVALVRLAPPHIGAGVVAHEMAHAAVQLRLVENQWAETPLTDENDEWFCWILGELVRQTTVKLYEKGVYPALTEEE